MLKRFFVIILGIITCFNITTAFGYEKEELVQLIKEKQTMKDKIHEMAEFMRLPEWGVTNEPFTEYLSERWWALDKEQQSYQSELNTILAQEAEEAKWITKSAQYPIATKIWRYMKTQGWNDYVCAGIMGNIMAEVGGQTLNIQPYLSSGGYYGICMWSNKYSTINGGSLEQQLDYLTNTIKKEFDVYGKNYASGFNYNSFLSLTDTKAAALSFAKAYERCTSASYGVRQNNAIKAYNYFVN